MLIKKNDTFFSILLLIKLQNSQTALQLTNPAHTRRRESTEQATTTHTPGHEMPSYHTTEKDQDWRKMRGGGLTPPSTSGQVNTSNGPVSQPRRAPKTRSHFWPSPKSATAEAIKAIKAGLLKEKVDGLKMRFRPNGRVYPVTAYVMKDGRLYLWCSSKDGGREDYFYFSEVKTIADFEKSQFVRDPPRDWSTLRVPLRDWSTLRDPDRNRSTLR